METREALQNEERRIHIYFFKDSALSNATPIQEIDYRNVIMLTDAYDSKRLYHLGSAPVRLPINPV
jgi:hypothetical protein